MIFLSILFFAFFLNLFRIFISSTAISGSLALLSSLGALIPINGVNIYGYFYSFFGAPSVVLVVLCVFSIFRDFKISRIDLSLRGYVFILIFTLVVDLGALNYLNFDIYNLNFTNRIIVAFLIVLGSYFVDKLLAILYLLSFIVYAIIPAGGNVFDFMTDFILFIYSLYKVIFILLNISKMRIKLRD